MLSILWQIGDIIGLVFIVGNGQISENNLTIWSHCPSNKTFEGFLLTNLSKRSTSVVEKHLELFFLCVTINEAPRSLLKRRREIDQFYIQQKARSV